MTGILSLRSRSTLPHRHHHPRLLPRHAQRCRQTTQAHFDRDLCLALFLEAVPALAQLVPLAFLLPPMGPHQGPSFQAESFGCSQGEWSRFGLPSHA